MATGKMYISMVLIVLMIGLAIFMYEVNQSNNYKQYVNAQIERHGGLTLEAIEEINQYSQEHFNGNFTIDSSQATAKEPFGTVVNYTAYANFKILFLEFDNVQIPLNGSTTSLVR